MRNVTVCAIYLWVFSGLCVAQTTAPPSPSAEPQASATDAAIPLAKHLLVQRRVNPVYPEAAKQLGVHGLVTIQVVVDEEGNVAGAQVVSGDPVLTPAAVDAVMHWKFAPYLVDGKPSKARTEVYVFVGPTPAGAKGGIISSTPTPAPGTAQMVRVSQSIMRGLLIHKEEPVYPENARAARIQGSVVLEAVIGPDGVIENLMVVSGHPMLVDAALDAVRQWRYKPFLLSGQPVTVDTMITVNFVLETY